MPNWCENTLQISGEKEELAKFQRAAKGENTALSLQKTCPRPEALTGTRSPTDIVSKAEYKKALKKGDDGVGLPITQEMSDEFINQYGADNWYDWQIKHWGTKWDIEAELVDDEAENGYLTYSFNSAWSPPVEWLEHVSREYPTIRFLLKYEEDGAGFMGRAKAIGGVVEDGCLDF